MAIRPRPPKPQPPAVNQAGSEVLLDQCQDLHMIVFDHSADIAVCEGSIYGSSPFQLPLLLYELISGRTGPARPVASGFTAY